jgi:hypothetical protein
MVYKRSEPAFARLVEERDEFRWVVDECPYCGRRHSHGGGPLGGDPRSFLFARTPHCDPQDVLDPPPPANYTLVEKE